MSDPVGPVGPLRPTGPRSHRRGDGSFAALLSPDGPGLPELLRGAASSISRGERSVARAMRAARSGHVFSHEELLALQAGVYRYTQELELASKLVDKATQAVKITLQSQQ